MQKKAYLSIISAAALWGCIGVFLRLLTAAGLDPWSRWQYAARWPPSFTFSGCSSLTGRRPGTPARSLVLCGDRHLQRALFNWCYFNAISLSALSVAAVLLYTSPVFVMLLSALCFQEPITPRKIGALLLTFCGCVLVAGLFPAGVGSISAAAVLFGLGSGFGYALYSIFSKLALKRYSPPPSPSILFCSPLWAPCPCLVYGRTPPSF